MKSTALVPIARVNRMFCTKIATTAMEAISEVVARRTSKKSRMTVLLPAFFAGLFFQIKAELLQQRCEKPEQDEAAERHQQRRRRPGYPLDRMAEEGPLSEQLSDKSGCKSRRGKAERRGEELRRHDRQ